MSELTLDEKISEHFKDHIVKTLQAHVIDMIRNAPSARLLQILHLQKPRFPRSSINKIWDIRGADIGKYHAESDTQIDLASNYVTDVKQAAILIGSGFIFNAEAISILEEKFNNAVELSAIEANHFSDLKCTELDILIVQYCNQFGILPEHVKPIIQRFAKVAGHSYFKALTEMGREGYFLPSSATTEILIKAHPETILRDAINTGNTSLIIPIMDMIREQTSLTQEDIVNCFPNAVDALSFCLRNRGTLTNEKYPGLHQKAMDKFLSVIFPILPGVKGRYGFDMRLVPNILALYEDVPDFLEGAVSLPKEQFIENVKARCDSVLDGMALFGETRMSEEELCIYISGMVSPERDFAINQAVATYQELDTSTKEVLVNALGANKTLRLLYENFLIHRVSTQIEPVFVSGSDPILNADLDRLLNTQGVRIAEEATPYVLEKIYEALGLDRDLKQVKALSGNEIDNAIEIRSVFMANQRDQRFGLYPTPEVIDLLGYLETQGRLFGSSDLVRTL